MERGSMELEGKVALVTGAESGIGKATAVPFARSGSVRSQGSLPRTPPADRFPGPI
jgi:hypothetical protein